MSFCVVSHRHGLIPFAFRLQNQGAKTELVVCTERFEKAWEGKFEKILPAKEARHVGNLEPVLEMTKAGEVIVLSDNLDVSRMFNGVPGFFGLQRTSRWEKPKSVLRGGFWWNGEELHNPHVLLCDVGVWPGGMGASELGGLTLIRLDGDNAQNFHQLTEPVLQLLREERLD